MATLMATRLSGYSHFRLEVVVARSLPLSSAQSLAKDRIKNLAAHNGVEEVPSAPTIRATQRS